jgi:signal peptidase II
LLALSGFTADIVTKSATFTRYFRPGTRPEIHWWIDGVLGIETTTNPGALFGMFAGYRGVFAMLSLAALTFIIGWLFAFRGARDLWLTISLGLVSGGILGNLYDRLGFGFRPGYLESERYNVRDWIYFRWEGVPWLDPWPNFNLADSLLVCGAILLVLHSFFGSDRAAESAARPKAGEPIA